MNNDLVYLNRRASEERSAAFKSRDREVAQIHRELANAYEFRVYLLQQMEALKAGQPTADGRRDGQAAATFPAKSAPGALPTTLVF